MPTVDIPVLASGDDVYIWRESTGLVWPPANAVSREPSNTAFSVAKLVFGGGTYYHSRLSLVQFATHLYIPSGASINSASLRLQVTSHGFADSRDFTLEWYMMTGTDSDHTSTSSNTAHTGTSISSINESAGG